MRKIFSTKLLVIFFSLLLVAQLVWNGYLYTLPSHTEMTNYWYNVMYGSTSIFIALVGLLSVYLGLERKSTLSRAVAFLSWGALANGLGLMYWAYNNIVGNVEIPYPSAGEYLFLAFPILMGIGFLMLLSLYRPLIRPQLVVEALIVTLISAAVIFRYFIIPNLSADSGLFANFVTMAIPTEDALIIALVYIALRVSGGKFHGYLWLYIWALLLLVAGDFVFQYRNAVGTYWNGDIADLLYTINMFVFSLAVIYTIDSSTQHVATPVIQQGTNAQPTAVPTTAP